MNHSPHWTKTLRTQFSSFGEVVALASAVSSLSGVSHTQFQQLRLVQVLQLVSGAGAVVSAFQDVSVSLLLWPSSVVQVSVDWPFF